MAEGLLRSLDPELDVHSAGTRPADRVHPGAIQAMAEIGIDISGHMPKNLDRNLSQPFDYVLTVCDNAKDTCPVFTGVVGRRLHMGFEDPAAATGTDGEVLNSFRRIRDQMQNRMRKFYDSEIRHSGR